MDPMPPPSSTPPGGHPREPMDHRADEGWPAQQEADPGTPVSRLIALVLAIVLGGAVILLQNVPPMIEMYRASAGAAEEGPAEVEGEPAPVAPPSYSSMADIMGRLYIKVGDVIAADPSAMPTIETYAVTDAERTRLIVVEAELNGAAAAVERSDELIEELDAEDPLAEDAAALRAIYADGVDAVSDETAARLRAHHGYFGEVALTYGMDDDSPERAALLAGGIALMVVLLGFGLTALLAFLVGVVLFFLGIVLVATRRIRASMPEPRAGGSVFLETFVFFVGGFLLLSVGSDLLAAWVTGRGGDATWVGYFTLGAQWALLLTPLWPLARGMSFARWRAAIGLHTGRGLFREIGMGILGYLAGLPLFVAGVVTTLVLVTIFQLIVGGEGPGTPTSNPVFDLVGSGDPVALVMVFLLATIWAPLCEELVFRGALHRHLRGRCGVVLASLVTASVFGFLHGYGPLLVFPLIALGLVFSAMREWRGSLVSCITAHALHNGTVLTLVITIFTLMGS